MTQKRSRLPGGKLARTIGSFARDERGATAIEYAIIAGGIMVVIVMVVGQIGTNLTPTFEDVRDGFN